MELPDFISDYSSLFNAIRKVVPPSMKIYLVGGAVRDILLGRRIREAMDRWVRVGAMSLPLRLNCPSGQSLVVA